MGFLKTLIGWATGAWNGIQGLGGAITSALNQLWQYITSLHNLLSWLAGNPILVWMHNQLAHDVATIRTLANIRDVLRRLPAWIWLHQVWPVYVTLLADIKYLRSWAVLEFTATWALIAKRYQAALDYAWYLYMAEVTARIAAINKEHAAMLLGDKATLATVQKQAASAYAAGVHARLGIAGSLLDDLVTRTPILKDLVNLVINGAIKLADIDDPVLAYVVKKAIDEIVGKAGIDQLAAQAAADLFAPVIGGRPPADLHGVIAAIDGRLTALEKNWAEFMKDGGPQVEQAGEEWKQITGLLVDVGFVAFTGLAVADPTAWATGVSDTIGVAGDDALTAIVNLINRI